MRQVLEWQDTSNPTELVNALKLDVFSGEVFVFTPKGDVVELPVGSTPIDFAYRIHSHVGDTTIGAIVNDQIVPLSYELKNDDVVSIKTNNNSTPNKDRLNIVKTQQAKNKIKEYRDWYLKHPCSYKK